MSAENSTEVTIFRSARKIECNNERAAFLDEACISLFWEAQAMPDAAVALTDANQGVLAIKAARIQTGLQDARGFHCR